MKNILTFKAESFIGIFMVASFALFMVFFMFSAVDQFNSEVDIINGYQEAKIKTINPTEKYLIDEWVRANGIDIPKDKGYRYVIEKYPSKPWLK